MRNRTLLIVSLLVIVSLVSLGTAQQPPSQEAGPKRSARAGQKTTPTEPGKDDKEPPTQTTEDELRMAIAGLANQVGLLTSELRRLRQETERSSSMIELLLYEERLAKLEEKIQEAIDYKAQLDGRETEIQRRQRTVQQEVTLRGGLRRDEAEAALRADLQRALEEVRSQQSNYQQRISELQVQADRLRKRVETLRKKLEPPPEKQETQ